MIKRTKFCKILTAAALVFCLTSFQSKIHADSSPTGPLIDSDITLTDPKISSENRTNPNKHSHDPELLPGAPWATESLTQKETKKRRTWVDLLVEADPPAGSEETMTDSAKEDLAKERLIHSAVQMVEKTELGKKIKQIEASVSNYLKFEYFKSFNEETIPDQESEKESDTNEKGYGVSFSPKIDVGSIDNPGVKADFTYSDTIVFTEYELQDNMIAVEFSNTTLNKHLDATASFGATGSDSDTSLIFKFKFDF